MIYVGYGFEGSIYCREFFLLYKLLMLVNVILLILYFE